VVDSDVAVAESAPSDGIDYNPYDHIHGVAVLAPYTQAAVVGKLADDYKGENCNGRRDDEHNHLT